MIPDPRVPSPVSWADCPSCGGVVPVGETGIIPRWMAVHKQSCFPKGMCDKLNQPGSGSPLFYINSYRVLTGHLIIRLLMCVNTINTCQFGPIHINTDGYTQILVLHTNTHHTYWYKPIHANTFMKYYVKIACIKLWKSALARIGTYTFVF